MNVKKIRVAIPLFMCITILLGCAKHKETSVKLDINTFLDASNEGSIYPSEEQIKMLEDIVPEHTYAPAPSIKNRAYWDKIAETKSGNELYEEALSFIERKPEVPISDAIYRRANKEGNRGIYKPRYYRTMDRLEKFILAECIENSGRFLPQIEVYIDSIMAMKSWMHPNHDDNENSVLEGKRVAIDLGARKFGLVLALANVLLDDKLNVDLKTEISTQLEWRITESYLSTCRGENPKSNSWIRSTSNWNSVCTSGTLFTTIVDASSKEERVAAIGCALNSMVYYLSGFGDDGYCSEGTGYWNYGFGHYLYLAELLHDYTDGKINLFEFNAPEKLKRVANFPTSFQIADGLYAPFSDGVTRVKDDSDNFAYFMAAKYYGTEKPARFIPDESVQTLLEWSDPESFAGAELKETVLPPYTYFDDFGIVISRGQQPQPFTFAIKAGHNAENHNHSDVGTYIISLGDDIITGDIGAPSYTAGAFSKTNPARSSWGHPVPRINNKLQSNGIEFSGKVISTSFDGNVDEVKMDIKSAYEIPSLESLNRRMSNNKAGDGTITVMDEFTASEPVSFGTALMVNVAYEIMTDNTIMITSENQKVKAVITAEGGNIKIKDEQVPVKHLRSGKTSYRIGIDFDKPLSKGSISIVYKPIINK